MPQKEDVATKRNLVVSNVLPGGIAATCLLTAANAWTYTPKWLECDGQKVTTETVDGKPKSSTEAAKDFYVTDDDGKNLFKYSTARKTENIEPVTSYTDKEIKWVGKGSSVNEPAGRAN